MEIRYIDYGIGYTVVDNDKIYIELNKALKKYPSLHDKVLNHEIQHYNKGNTEIDFWVDFWMLFNVPLQIELFMFKKREKSAKDSNKIFFYENGKKSFNKMALIIFLLKCIFIFIDITLVLMLIKIYN